MVGKEPAALNNIVTAARNKRGTHNANNLGEEIVVLLKGARICAVDLQFRICTEKSRDLEGTEEVGMKDILGPRTSLCEFKKKGKTCVLIVLLLRSAYGRRISNILNSGVNVTNLMRRPRAILA